MLVPNRHGSSNSYRYGFQGQEKDDELKGEGNSLNYTYRMHDPRVGRFFAIDPLTKSYPHYTPYSFSGNKVIAYVELEGLEETGYTRMLDKKLGSKAYLQMTTEERIEERKNNAIAFIVTLGIAADIVFNQGKVTIFLTRQAATQLVVNTAASGLVYAFSSEGENKFEPTKIFEETITGFDFADAGIDKGFEIVLDKYKIGKIREAIKIVAPSLFDITIKDGVQFIGFKKDAESILTDVIGNVLTEGIEKKFKLKDIPKIKLSSATQSQIIGKTIMEEFKGVLEDKSFPIEVKTKEIEEEMKVKKDAIYSAPKRDVSKDKIKKG
jgi:RHS repeat-associated protein